VRFIVHTPDGETYTAPDNTYPHIEEGTGALHIIQDGGEWRTIAVFPEGQWTRYIPADESTAGEYHDETWDELLNEVWTFIKPKLKTFDNGQHFIVGDEASLYRAYRNATKRNKAGIR
jgi:hypothetical protein